MSKYPDVIERAAEKSVGRNLMFLFFWLYRMHCSPCEALCSLFFFPGTFNERMRRQQPKLRFPILLLAAVAAAAAVCVK